VAREPVPHAAVAADGGAAAKAAGKERDTFFLKNASVPTDAPRLDLARVEREPARPLRRRTDSAGDEGRIEAGGSKASF
jgi:hypothetical protein